MAAGAASRSSWRSCRPSRRSFEVDRPFAGGTAMSAIVRPSVLNDSIKVEPLTCSLGAELSGVDLGDASRDDALFAEIHALLLKHKVLFLRDQQFSRAE